MSVEIAFVEWAEEAVGPGRVDGNGGPTAERGKENGINIEPLLIIILVIVMVDGKVQYTVITLESTKILQST